MREGTELIDEAIAAWDELLKHHGSFSSAVRQGFFYASQGTRSESSR